MPARSTHSAACKACKAWLAIWQPKQLMPGKVPHSRQSRSVLRSSTSSTHPLPLRAAAPLGPPRRWRVTGMLRQRHAGLGLERTKLSSRSRRHRRWRWMGWCRCWCVMGFDGGGLRRKGQGLAQGVTRLEGPRSKGSTHLPARLAAGQAQRAACDSLLDLTPLWSVAPRKGTGAI